MRHGRPQSDLRVLITGASGFIGRHCLPMLRQAGFEVHAVTSRVTFDTDPSICWHRADLLNPHAARQLIAVARPSHLLHLAWITSPGSYRTSPENARWADASLELVRQFAAGGGRRVVIAGTCLEYTKSDRACHEDATRALPTTPYGQSKLALWQSVEQLAAEQGLSAAATRTFYLYGPHENPQRFVPSVIRPILDGGPAPCSSGLQLRDFLHVHDVAAAHVRLLASDVQGPVNVAAGKAIAVKDVALAIGDLLGRRELVQLGELPLPASEPPVLTADVTRLKQEVSWSPKYDLRQGLQNTIEWWRHCTTQIIQTSPALFAAIEQPLGS